MAPIDVRSVYAVTWRDRLRRARGVIAVAALVFFLLGASGMLPAVLAAAAFAAIAAIAIAGAGGAIAADLIDREAPRSRIEDLAIETVISGLPDPAIVLQRDGIVLAFNGHARRLAPALARGEPISFALRHPDVIEAIRRAGAEREARRAEFFERVPADRWSEAIVAPVVLPEETAEVRRPILIMTIHDLTPLRRVEEMRADFVANASHELRTPLASLSGFIETLQGPAREDVQARERFLGIMKEQARRMARLIDDLLSLSRIELKAHIRPETPVDLASIVRQVADGLQMLAQERGVTITIDSPPGRLLTLGDRDELIRVFENLVENALKYGASGKRVEIALGHERQGADGEAVVAVRDHGPGIAPEHLPRLTERFYRVDVAESRAHGGTGLGLALVKHILQRHRGRLSIESVPGAGATFAVRLPLTAINSAEEEKAS